MRGGRWESWGLTQRKVLSLVATPGDKGQEAGRLLAGDTGGAGHWGGGHQPCHWGGEDINSGDTNRVTARPGHQGEDTSRQ